MEKENECEIYREWLFSHTEDSGEAESDCPCGKKVSDIFAILETKLLKSKRLLAPHVQSSLMRV